MGTWTQWTGKPYVRQMQRGAVALAVAGMLAASVFGIFLIPMLYVVFQRLTEGRKPKDADGAESPTQAT